MIEDGRYERIGLTEKKLMPDYISKYQNKALITPSQIECMIGLIKEYTFGGCDKITNMAEVGVSCGLTDLYLLKGGVKYNDDFHLWGFEILTSDDMGFIPQNEATPEELSHWSFGKGKTIYDIESFIPNGTRLDAIFIDGMHAHPYPLIDLIFLLPYLREDGLILLHDCEYYWEQGENGNSYIFTAWQGDKYLNKKIDLQGNIIGEETLGIIRNRPRHIIQNILLDVAKIPIDTPKHVEFNTTSEEREKGRYLGIEIDLIVNRIKPYMMKHYDMEFVNAFTERLCLTVINYRDNENYMYHTSRRTNYILDRLSYLERRLNELESR